MAGDNKKLQPIIVKRVKKAAHGHHGGAWKIAYADFVTAMMAFFLLMWLLSSTTEGDRRGIADYFANPLRLSLSGGSGSGDSSHVIKGGGQDLSRTTGQVKRGDIEVTREQINLHPLKSEQYRADVVRLEALKESIDEMISSNPALAPVRDQIRTEMNRDGLRIHIVDAGNRPMFATGSAVVLPHTRDLLREVARTLAQVPNRLTLEGHTDATPYAGGERGFSNWELSADRANASRRELIAAGLGDDRILRVQGLASSIPLVPGDPLAPANRRISIIVMNREAEDRVRQLPATDLSPGASGGAAASAQIPGIVPNLRADPRPPR